MKLRRPPAIAAWLIERNSPLAGDLLEEFQRGKSRGWFWRQALAAVAAGCERNIRVSRLYLRAYLIGVAAQVAVVLAVRQFLPSLLSSYWPILFVATIRLPVLALRSRVAGSIGGNLQRLLAESGEMALEKRTAIARLVAADTFSMYLIIAAVGGDLSSITLALFETLLLFVDLVRVVFRRIDSGRRLA
jgi:hypothetical protein